MVVRPTKARDAQQQPLKDPPAELHDRRERGGARSRLVEGGVELGSWGAILTNDDDGGP